ncbi:MAG: hypothetical protein A3J79_12755, partial [Elusimicrobia bacterium RIFOXYB2_FULL_62_6]
LLLGAAFVFWASGRGRQSAQQFMPVSGKLTDGIIAYINSPEADTACGPCLASANNFLKEKKEAELREKTKDMARLPAGEYFMGSPEGAGDPDEHPRHAVYLDAFYIDKYETTIGDYMRFVKDTSGNYPEWAKPNGKFNIDSGKEDYYKRLYSLLKTCETCPIAGVTAQNAQAYCASKNRRLPTEAEWEAAARAGSETEFSFGGNSVPAGDYAWHDGNSGAKPHPVGEKKPNPLGLYDIHGNVWEWTSDYYEKWYYQKSPNNSYASATPALDAEHVYVTWSTPDHYLVLALKHSDGSEVWRYDLGPFDGEHGYGASPIVVGRLVILANEQNGPGSMVALDAASGAERWKTPRRAKRAAYCTPCLFEAPGAPPQLILTGWAHGVSSLDPQTGKPLWELPVFTYRVVSSPLVAAGLIFAGCGGGGSGKPFVAVRPGNPAQGIKPEVA